MARTDSTIGTAALAVSRYDPAIADPYAGSGWFSAAENSAATECLRGKQAIASGDARRFRGEHGVRALDSVKTISEIVKPDHVNSWRRSLLNGRLRVSSILFVKSTI
jgi:hypothetical protein